MINNLIEIHKANLFLDCKQILHDINWQVLQSEHWFIIGPNGSGKTTINQNASWLCLAVIRRKKFQFLATPMANATYSPSRKKIAWISPFLQSWTSTSKNYTVEEIIISGIDSTIGLFRNPEDSERDQALEILENLGAKHLAG